MEHTSKVFLTRRRYRLRRVAWLVALTLVTVVGGAWFRDSSLVAVKHVTVQGANGADAISVRNALAGAAQDMTTLHLRQGDLRTAVEPYPSVASISVERHFPNSLTIKVRSREPVAAIAVGSARIAVAEDGVILRGTRARGVPVVPLRMPPTGARVTEPQGLRALSILGAAPKPLLVKVHELKFTHAGVIVTLTKGPQLRFGTANRPHAKWAAIARVLADSSSRGATYIDVHLPERPAAGGLEDPSTQRDPRTGDDAVTPAQQNATNAIAQTTPVAPAATNSQ